MRGSGCSQTLSPSPNGHVGQPCPARKAAPRNPPLNTASCGHSGLHGSCQAWSVLAAGTCWCWGCQTTAKHQSTSSGSIWESFFSLLLCRCMGSILPFFLVFEALWSVAMEALLNLSYKKDEQRCGVHLYEGSCDFGSWMTHGSLWKERILSRLAIHSCGQEQKVWIR